MKTHSLRFVVALLVGSSLTLTSCQYPYYSMGPNQRAGTLYGAAGGALLGGLVSHRHPMQGVLVGGLLGGLAGNAIGASRDRYYPVRGGSVYSSRYYSGRPSYYSSSSYRRPYYSSSYYRPPYRPTPFNSSYNYRPWGGYYGRSFPYSGWGTTGLGFGTRWF